jgi:hypothetical protein
VSPELGESEGEMIYLSNLYFFPALQLGLMVLWLFAMYKDSYPSGIGIVTRSSDTMTTLQKVTGLVIAAIITIINKSVFDTKIIWSDYSALINALDLAAIVYVCYFSRWGRNRIVAITGRSNIEHH